MPDTITLGSLAIPSLLIAVISMLAASWLVGRVPLKKDKDSVGIFTDLFATPILPFLLGWKLSLLMTDGGDVLAQPSMLLYGTGGRINIIIGLLVGLGWLGYRLIRHRPRKELFAAMARSYGLFTILVVVMVFLYRPVPIQARPEVPGVVLMTESQEPWEISEANGNPLILNFWASWCPPCRAEMPMLENFAGDGRLGNATFWAVNAVHTEKSSTAGRTWLDENDLDVPMLLDSYGQGNAVFGITALPTTVVLDAQGRLVARKTGAVNRGWLNKALREARKQDGGA